MEKQESSTARAFCSIGELESLGDDLSQTLSRQGLELVRLEEASCRCVPSATGSYFTPVVADEDGSLSGRVSPVLSLSAVGLPSGSQTLLVSPDEILALPLKKVIALRVPVSPVPLLWLFRLILIYLASGTAVSLWYRVY